MYHDLLLNKFLKLMTWCHQKWILPWNEYQRISFNTGSGNGLVPNGTKPLPKTVLPKISWCHLASLGHNEWKWLRIFYEQHFFNDDYEDVYCSFLSVVRGARDSLSVQFARTWLMPAVTTKTVWLTNVSATVASTAATWSVWQRGWNVKPFRKRGNVWRNEARGKLRVHARQITRCPWRRFWKRNWRWSPKCPHSLIHR